MWLHLLSIAGISFPDLHSGTGSFSPPVELLKVLFRKKLVGLKKGTKFLICASGDSPQAVLDGGLSDFMVLDSNTT